MRRTLFYLVMAMLVLLIAGVAMFHFTLELPWVDATHFTLTTVGCGDFQERTAPMSVKLFGVALMLSGTASVAVIFAMITDYVFRLNLEEILGRRKRRMKDHIILCGLGNVGMRILEQLHRMGEKVIVIELRDEAKHLPSAKRMDVPVLLADARTQVTLEEAHVADAKCLIAATNDDLANLEAALNARTARPGIRIILRMFDQNLANKVRDGFGIETAFSTSALAAPAFAMASLHPSVRGSFFVGEDLMLNVELVVAVASKLADLNTGELMDQGRYAILAHECGKTARRSLNPSDPIDLSPGDLVVVATPREDLDHLHDLNRSRAGQNA
jgi:Trk K+ transport system NAD-binding subunit